MGLAEDGVVDFLTDSVQDGDVVVGVLGATMALDGLVAFRTLGIQTVQEVGVHHVVGIKDDHEVKVAYRLVAGHLSFHLLKIADSILQGFGLAALLKDRLQEGNGQLGELLVGLRLHVVGDDGQMEVLVGIVLAHERLYGVDDDAVFVVSGIEHQELVIFVGMHGCDSVSEHDRQS